MKRTILALSLALMIGAVACKNETSSEGTPVEPTTVDSVEVKVDSVGTNADTTQPEAPKAEEKTTK